jgi:hypothetical protein
MEAVALEIVGDVLRSGALAGLLGTEPDDGGAFARDAAGLSLVVHLALIPQTHMFFPRVRRALDVLAVLERVSHSLGAFPLAKRAFWSQVLDHPRVAVAAGERYGVALHWLAPVRRPRVPEVGHRLRRRRVVAGTGAVHRGLAAKGGFKL